MAEPRRCPRDPDVRSHCHRRRHQRTGDRHPRARPRARLAVLKRERLGSDCLWNRHAPSKASIASVCAAHRRWDGGWPRDSSRIVQGGAGGPPDRRPRRRANSHAFAPGDGLAVHTGSGVQRIGHEGPARQFVWSRAAGAERPVTVSEVLAAARGAPDLEGLWVERLRPARRGPALAVDASLHMSVARSRSFGWASQPASGSRCRTLAHWSSPIPPDSERLFGAGNLVRRAALPPFGGGCSRASRVGCDDAGVASRRRTGAVGWCWEASQSSSAQDPATCRRRQSAGPRWFVSPRCFDTRTLTLVGGATFGIRRGVIWVTPGACTKAVLGLVIARHHGRRAG